MTAVRSTSRNQAASGTATTVAVPTGAADGDVILVIGHINNNPTWTDNNGANSLTKDNTYQPAGNAALHVWSVRVTTAKLTAWGGTLAFTAGASTRWTLVAVCIQDPDPSVIYDATTVEGQFDSTGSTTGTANAITATAAGAIHLPCFGADGSGTTITTTPLTSASYTVAQNGGNQALCVAHKTVSSGSTGTTTVTLPASTQWLALSIAVRIAAAGLAPTSRTPADNATNVAYTTNTLSLTFNGNIQAGSGNIVLKRSSGTTVETIAIGSGQVNISGAVLTVTLSSQLGDGSFYVEIANTAIEPSGGGTPWAGFSGATDWNFSVPAKLSRAPILCTDINPYINSSGVGGDSNEIKAGITSWHRTEGYPDAPGKYSGLAEVIESGAPQPTFPARIAGSQPLTLGYDPAAGVGGPAIVWGAGESGSPYNNEDVTECIIPRRDGPGWIAFCHYGNNGSTREILVKYNTSYDLTTGWSEISGKPHVAVGTAGQWDDAGVPDGNFVWIGDQLIGFYRGAADGSSAQVGRVSATWTGAVGSFPTLTKYASNPVIATGAGGSWSNSGIASGGLLVEPASPGATPRINMWPSARLTANGFGFAYSDDLGITWTVSSTAVVTPSGSMTSCGDQTWVCDERTPRLLYGGDIAWVDFGADRTTSEGRNLSILPYEKDVAFIKKRGRFYYPTGTPYSSLTVGASGGGIQQYATWALAFRFRIARTVRTNFPTLFQQGDSNTDNHCYARIDGSGLFSFFWSTTTTGTSGPPFDVTLTSSTAVDDGKWHKAMVVRVGTGELRLYVERDGTWALEDTDTSETDLGTFTSAVNMALGNGHPSNNYGNLPFRGTIADVVFASGGTVPTSTVQAAAACAEGLLDSSRTVYAGGTLRWTDADGTATGDVVNVEAAASLEIPYVSTDGSTATSDHTASGSHFIPTGRGRIGVLALSMNNTSTGVTAITIDGVTMTLAKAETVSGAGSAIYYVLGDQLPTAAGNYTWSVTVDGASGEVNAAFWIMPGQHRQKAPTVNTSATGTATTLSASLGVEAPSTIVNALYNAGATDDATPHATETELADFSTDTTNGPRLACSIRQAWVQGTFTPSWSAITNSTQHVMAAVAFETATELSPPFTRSAGARQLRANAIYRM